jgi:hypothetical protein
MIAGKQMQWTNLPSMEPDVINGDFIQYPIWIKVLRALIEVPIRSNVFVEHRVKPKRLFKVYWH